MSHYQVKTDTNGFATSIGKFLTMFQRKLLQTTLEGDLPKLYRQRICIMLLTDEGKSQTEICHILGCCPATARHWMHIARSGMAHQWQDCAIGRPKAVQEEYLDRLKVLVNSSPRDYGYVFRRWTANWLSKHLAKEFGVEVSDRHIKRLLKQMGLSTRSKPSNASVDRTEKAKGSKILIYDLNSENIPDNSGILPINFAKLGTDLEIYGGKAISGIGLRATSVEYFAAFCNYRNFPFNFI